MAKYNIKKSDGTSIVIDENIIDKSQFSVGLVGHGQPEYGATQNQNFVQMLENFANNREPANPTIGQLWYDKSEEIVKVCKSLNPTVWMPLLKKNDTTSPQEPTPAESSEGDIWYNNRTGQLEVYDEDKGWVPVGPDSTEDIERKDEYNDIDSSQQKSDFNVDKISFDSYGLYLVKLNILATGYSEIVINDDIQRYVNYDDRFCCWCYKVLIRKYKTGTGDAVEILGEPSYELLSSSPDINWDIKIHYDNPSINNGLKIELDKHNTGGNNISVVYDVEVVKNKLEENSDTFDYYEES